MDEREAIEAMAEAGQAVSSTINSKGWRDVIRPVLTEKRNLLYMEFINAQPEDFVRIQQQGLAIDWLINFIEVTLIEGKTALEELKKNP